MTVCERGRIDSALAEIESRHGCRVLFAVESGSRAWGFASPDSDYDVRGVYVKSLDWYLQLQSDVSDTIVEYFPGDIDIALWDLRKALVQMTKSNASFMEWLGSGIVYRDRGILSDLNRLKGECFNPVHVSFHYASMFRKAMDARRDDGTIPIKKLCYALRANLCVRYVEENGSMPPTAFSDVLEGVSLETEERDAINAVLNLKEIAQEGDVVALDRRLSRVLEDRYDSLGDIKRTDFSRGRDVYGKCETLFRNCVKQFSDTSA